MEGAADQLDVEGVLLEDEFLSVHQDEPDDVGGAGEGFDDEVIHLYRDAHRLLALRMRHGICVRSCVEEVGHRGELPGDPAGDQAGTLAADQAEDLSHQLSALLAQLAVPDTEPTRPPVTPPSTLAAPDTDPTTRPEPPASRPAPRIRCTPDLAEALLRIGVPAMADLKNPLSTDVDVPPGDGRGGDPAAGIQGLAGGGWLVNPKELSDRAVRSRVRSLVREELLPGEWRESARGRKRARRFLRSGLISLACAGLLRLGVGFLITSTRAARLTVDEASPAQAGIPQGRGREPLC